MTSQDTSPGGASADEAKRRLESAAHTVRDDAASAGQDALSRAEGEAERQKEMGAGHLDAFADAVRKAADELGEHDESAAAQFVRQAAGGLENLSGSLRQKSVGDLVDSVSRFGRTNPTAFLGGALLAGVALGRFAQASAERPHVSRGSVSRSGGTSRSRDWSSTGSSDFGGSSGGTYSEAAGSPGRPGSTAGGAGATGSTASAGSAAAGSTGSAGATARPFPSSVNTGGSDDATR